MIIRFYPRDPPNLHLVPTTTYEDSLLRDALARAEIPFEVWEDGVLNITEQAFVDLGLLLQPTAASVLEAFRDGKFPT